MGSCRAADDTAPRAPHDLRYPPPMLATCLLVVAHAVIAGDLPPLSDAEATRLAAAIDDADVRDEAFVALVEHIERWPMGSTAPDAGVSLDALVADPVSHRGEAARLTGRLEQRTPQPAPWDDVEEWFVRTDGGAAAVYVAGVSVDGPRVGDTLQLSARFYKRLHLVGRDGQRRHFAAFVAPASGVQVLAAAPADATNVRLLLVPLGGGLFLAVLLVAWSRRSKPMSAARGQWSTQEVLDAADDAAQDLPPDPAEALRALHARAGGPS